MRHAREVIIRCYDAADAAADAIAIDATLLITLHCRHYYAEETEAFHDYYAMLPPLRC